jgi:AcrR family transcriptional regulator
MHADHDGCPTGLRERKKLATREALSWAAMRLAVERGVENVRVEDIAAAAGVSPRTYNNYFSSREEAICALRLEQARRIGAGLRGRPAGEPLAEAIVGTMTEQYLGGAEPDRDVIRLVASTPALLGEFLKAGIALERELAGAIAERIGADPEQDLFAQVLAAAVAGAARVATKYWMRPENTASYASLLRAAIEQVASTVAPPEPAGAHRHHAPTNAAPVPPYSPTKEPAC